MTVMQPGLRALKLTAVIMLYFTVVSTKKGKSQRVTHLILTCIRECSRRREIRL